jgi:hypothetical protein
MKNMKVMKKGFDDLYYAVIGAVKILHELHGLHGESYNV